MNFLIASSLAVRWIKVSAFDPNYENGVAEPCPATPLQPFSTTY
jgi:hypothetical protein